jgi:hypothetical protein
VKINSKETGYRLVKHCVICTGTHESVVDAAERRANDGYRDHGTRANGATAERNDESAHRNETIRKSQGHSAVRSIQISTCSRNRTTRKVVVELIVDWVYVVKHNVAWIDSEPLKLLQEGLVAAGTGDNLCAFGVPCDLLSGIPQ